MVARLDRLTVFAHLWAVATLSSGLRWLTEDGTAAWAWGWPMVVTAIALLARPRSLPVLLSVAAVHVGFVVAIHPFTPNHVLFESVLDAVLIVLAVFAGFARGASREWVAERFAAVARLSLLVLYFFTVLHKLNRDFFDPDVSCGPALLSLLSKRLPVPSGEWIDVLTIWGTIGVEIAIPLLLCFTPTRRWGIVLGIAFHAAIAQLPRTGLYSFTTMMLAMYVLFLPPEFFTALSRRTDAVLARVRRGSWRGGLRWGGAVVVAGAIAVAAWAYDRDRLLLFGLSVWNVWLVFALWLAVPPLLSAGSAPLRGSLFRLRHPLLAAAPLLLFLNGMSPYLGLKTLTSFAMLSNLRTEGGETNHFFMRRWVSLTTYQDDLVEIMETDHPVLRGYREGELLIPYFELRRLSSEADRAFTVRYLRNGELHDAHVLPGGGRDQGELVKPHPRWRAAFFGFRPVDVAPAMRCRK